MNQSKIKQWVNFPVIPPLLGGCLLALAFAPFNLKILAILAPVILLQRLYDDGSLRRAALDGFCFGVGFYGISIYWLYITLSDFAGVALLLAIAMTAGVAMLLSLYVVCSNVLAGYLGQGSRKRLAFAFCCSWVLFEYLRSHLFSGFSWDLLGYSQQGWLLRGYIPVLGVYGLSFIVLLLSSALWMMMAFRKDVTAIKALVCALAILLIGVALGQKNWVQLDKKNGMKVALVQGNIEQNLKWSPNELLTSLNTYEALTKRSLDADIIVWPESALPVFPNQIQSYLDGLSSHLTHHNTLVYGIPTVDPKDKRVFYNSVNVLGNGSGHYNKHHLVPFGEYFPMAWVTRPVLHMLHIPMDSFTPGKKNQPLLNVHQIPTAVFLCYEIIFPDLVLNQSRGSGLLMTLSDDSWYRDSIALDQHLQMAAFQSEQSERYQLFVSNSGITAIIDPHGNVVKYLPLDKAGVLYGTIYPVIQHPVAGAAAPVAENTPIMNYGYAYLWLIIFISLVILLILRFKRPGYSS